VKVIVVGAGVAGCAIAYELARRGAQVTLLDARKPGRGATFASAGILTPAIEGNNAALLHLTSCSLAIYDEFIRRVCADAHVDIDYARNGTLQVAFTNAESAALEENARRFASTGVEHVLLDPHEAAALEPALSTSIVSALRLPKQGYVSAEQLVDALVQAAVTHGAVVVNSRVERIDEGAKGATVEDVGFDERTTVEGVRMLLNAAVALVPALDRAQLQQARVGLRPKTEDELPAIGRSSTMHHVFHAMGLYRNGVLLAPLTAMLVADLVLEGREHDELKMVRPDRFGL
jgi:glycine/D-amino acid oxidase-like deaminating enzyme